MQAISHILIAVALMIVSTPLHANMDCVKSYNDGTAAYHRGEFAKAADSLRSSLKTDDLDLQRRAYYNLGNSLYRHGQASKEKEPETTIKQWQQSLKAYQDALALDSSDADARYNHDLVKKKLEELQQQQNKQNSQNSDDKEKKEEEKEENKKQEQEQQQQDQQKQNEQEQQQKQQQQNQQEQKEGQEVKEMTKEEAMQLLQSLRQDERQVIPIPRQQQRNSDNTTKGKTW